MTSSSRLNKHQLSSEQLSVADLQIPGQDCGAPSCVMDTSQCPPELRMTAPPASSWAANSVMSTVCLSICAAVSSAAQRAKFPVLQNMYTATVPGSGGKLLGRGGECKRNATLPTSWWCMCITVLGLPLGAPHGRMGPVHSSLCNTIKTKNPVIQVKSGCSLVLDGAQDAHLKT